MPSVLQTWVQEIPLKEQGVLALAIRGPDGTPKEHGAKNVVRALRGSFLVTGVTGEALLPGTNLPHDNFMEMYRIGTVDETPWKEAVLEFYKAWDEYNIHFLLHLLHAAEILGYRHPDDTVRNRWLKFYLDGVFKMHLNPETFDQMKRRLDGPAKNSR